MKTSLNPSCVIIVLLVAYALRMQGGKDQVDHFNGNRDTTGKVIPSQSKFFLIIDQLKL
jgi:hypothetical protein